MIGFDSSSDAVTKEGGQLPWLESLSFLSSTLNSLSHFRFDILMFLKLLVFECSADNSHVSSSSCESDSRGLSSFFLFINTRNDTAREKEYSCLVSFVHHPGPRPPRSPTRGHPGMGQSPTCLGAKATWVVYLSPNFPCCSNTNPTLHKINPGHLPI